MDGEDRMQDQTPEFDGPQGGHDEDREFDALADLFLGDSAMAPRGERDEPRSRATGTDATPMARREERPAARARVEAVMLGHLPVRAGIWVRQYAASVADASHAPVALVRQSREMTTVELVGPGTPRGMRALTRVEDAIEAARSVASRWIVRVDEVDEPALTEADGIDEVSVLTGADEAAVVASYRLVKSLGGDWDARFGDDEGPGLRLAIMGAESEAASAASEKLERAARAFLQRPVLVSARVPRIGATSSASLYRGECELGIDEILDRIHGRARSVEEPVLRLATNEDDAWDDAEESGEARAPEIVVRPLNRADVAEPGKPSTAASRFPALASLIPGLTLLEARCPKSGSVELATDIEGRLHLLTASGDDPTAPIDRLVAASAWAREHLALLLRAEPSLAQPGGDREDDSEFTLHLVTRHPKLVRPLLDAEVRVHLLTEVEVSGQVVRVTTELN